MSRQDTLIELLKLQDAKRRSELSAATEKVIEGLNGVAEGQRPGYLALLKLLTMQEERLQETTHCLQALIHAVGTQPNVNHVALSDAFLQQVEERSGGPHEVADLGRLCAAMLAAPAKP